ncbi:MAG: glycosyltransferase [Leptolyngbyaceae cyanobacterium RU_5_1]|nr:glycosyltransferase [Leptolyngbyaceae cyanobacterium RU_5_1]
MSPLISLIITTYNREQYLGKAIESVLQQTYRNVELLVWDDGSSDRSIELAQKYAQRDRRVRVIAVEHQGASAAFKGAVAQTTGTYLGCLDSDDFLAPTTLEQTARVLDADPTIGMVYTDYLDLDQQGDVVQYGQRCSIPYARDRLLVDFMTFHFRLLRRSVYEQVGGVDTTFPYAHDYDLCLKISEVTTIYHLQQPLYYYRNHAQSISQAQRIKQTENSWRAVTNALERRGLSDRYAIAVEPPQGRFILHRKPRSRK